MKSSRRAAFSLAFALAACTPHDGRLTNAADLSAMQDAQQREHNGDIDAASAIYQQISQRSPDALPPRLALASLMRKSGHTQEALQLLKEAQKQHPDDEGLLTQLGYALIENGQSEEAVAVFDHLITLSANNIDAYNGKGVAFDHAGNHLAAQDIYEQALKVSPDSKTVQNNLAMSMILNGQYAPAIALLEKLDSQGSNITVRQNLAMAYGLSGNAEKALEINKRDLPPEQAEENVRFYEEYAQKNAGNPAAGPNAQIGFADTPASIQQAPAASDKPASEAKAALPSAQTPAPSEPPSLSPVSSPSPAVAASGSAAKPAADIPSATEVSPTVEPASSAQAPQPSASSEHTAAVSDTSANPAVPDDHSPPAPGTTGRLGPAFTNQLPTHASEPDAAAQPQAHDSDTLPARITEAAPSAGPNTLPAGTPPAEAAPSAAHDFPATKDRHASYTP